MSRRRLRVVLVDDDFSGLAGELLGAHEIGLLPYLHRLAHVAQVEADDDGVSWLVRPTGDPLLAPAELAYRLRLTPAELELGFQRLERAGRLTRMGEVYGIRAAQRPRGRLLSQTPDAIRARARRAQQRGAAPDYGIHTPVPAVATAVVGRSIDERPAVDRPTTSERPHDDRSVTAQRPDGDRTTTAGRPDDDRATTVAVVPVRSADPPPAHAPTPAAPELLRAPVRSSPSSSSDQERGGGESGRRSVGRDRRPARPELDALARHLRDLPNPTDADLQLLDRAVLAPLCELYSELCSARLREVGQEPPEPTNALRRALVARLQEDAGWIHADRWRARVQALADDDWCWKEKRPRPGAAVVPATLEWLIANVEKVHAVRAQAPRARPVGHSAICHCASCRAASAPARAVGCG